MSTKDRSLLLRDSGVCFDSNSLNTNLNLNEKNEWPGSISSLNLKNVSFNEQKNKNQGKIKVAVFLK